MFGLKRFLSGVFRKNGSKTIIFIFLSIIIAGAVLLSLPVSSKSGEGTSFVDALFTSTSATCVTGLIVMDTYTYWSFFGQMVILILIQVGGLGLMTMSTFFALITNRSIGLGERLLMKETLNVPDTGGIVKMTKHILFGTFAFEALGAILLSTSFIPRYGVKRGIYKSVFHSVSAFCNAGFDVSSDAGQFSSLATYVDDPVINITVMLLIITGGIGFLVWEDFFQFRKTRRLSINSKVVVMTTAALILSGAVLFFVFEHDNPETMGELSTGEAVMASFFQSVSPRTAGYATIMQDKMTDASKFFTSCLMFVGGSPGSTAGGIKVTSFFVLIVAAWSVVRGRNQIVIFGRRVSHGTVMRAIAITVIGFGLVIAGTMAILSLDDSYEFLDVLFEALSAFGTVGLSLGLTTQIETAGKIVLMLLMFLGKIGVLTAAIAFLQRMKKENSGKISYPEGRIMIG